LAGEPSWFQRMSGEVGRLGTSEPNFRGRKTGL